VAVRIKLRFQEVGNLLEIFFKSLANGKVTIPTKRRYGTGSELELEVYFPELAEPQTINCRVMVEDSKSGAVEVEPTNLDQVEAVFAKLAQIPAYEGLLAKPKPRVIIESVEEEELGAEAKEEPPEVTIKVEKPAAEPKHEQARPASRPAPPVKRENEAAAEKSAPEMAEGPTVTIKTVSEHETGKPAEPVKHEPAAPSSHVYRQLQVEIPTQKPPGPEIKPAAGPTKKPVSKEPLRPEPVKAVPAPEEPEAPKVEPAKPADPFAQLKSWLRVKEKPKEKKTGEKDQQTEGKLAPKELELRMVGPASEFVQNLVKAMLRSGYYSPDHPEAAVAKEGLYQDFKKAVADSTEFGFVLQHRVGQSTEILISGITEDPIPLKKVLGSSTHELFFPKYMDYFVRKRLVSFAIKSNITEGHFNKFVDVMSDPAVDKGEASESGRLLTRMLVENGINEISAIFEDDLISIETDLPWRVEMGIQRLAKDLKVLPLFKGMDAKQMTNIKRQIVQDILRPLRQPQFLKDIILNAYLIAQQVREINEEELEIAIIDNFPLQMLLPTSEFIFQEYHKMTEAKPANEREKEIVNNRIRAVKRILKNIARRVIEGEVEGADKFLEGLFEQKILTFEELPDSVQEVINIRRMREDFQKQPFYWLSKFSEAHKKDEVELFMQFFSKIIPGLIEEKDYQSLYLITDGLKRIPEPKLKVFAEAGAPNPIQMLWGEKSILLAKNLAEETGETRKGLEEMMLLLGEIGLNAVYRAMLQIEEPSKKKLLIDKLARFGPKALELFRGILKDPTKPWNIQALALEALGRAKNPADADTAKRFLKHSKPEMRVEAVTALVRILGFEAMPFITGSLRDPEPAVAKRTLAALGGFASAHAEARTKLKEIAFNEELSNDIRGQAVHELGRALPQSEEEKQELQEKLLEIVCEGEGFGSRLRKAFSGVSEDVEKLKSNSLDILGKIGDEEALLKLSKLNIAGKELKAKLVDVLNQLHLRLDTKKS